MNIHIFLCIKLQLIAFTQNLFFQQSKKLTEVNGFLKLLVATRLLFYLFNFILCLFTGNDPANEETPNSLG